MPGFAALRSLSIFAFVAAVARIEAVDALACQSASTDAATFVQTALDYIVVGEYATCVKRLHLRRVR